MTIRDLIDLFAAFDDRTLVVLASQTDGGIYSPFDGYDTGFYRAKNDEEGTFISDEEADTEDLEPEDGDEPAIVLYPVK